MFSQKYFVLICTGTFLEAGQADPNRARKNKCFLHDNGNKSDKSFPLCTYFSLYCSNNPVIDS